MYLPGVLMHLRVVSLVVGLVGLVVLGVPVAWWWVLALPHLLLGAMGVVSWWMDVYLERLVEQEITGPHP